jgi:hypothetical protein
MPTTAVPGPLRRRSPRVVLAAAAALIALTVSTLGGAAGAQSGASPAEAAGSWLADQLVDGERFEADFGGTIYPDHGLTADTVVALAAAGVADDFAAAATAWLGESENTDAYAGNGTDSSSSGGLAKLAIVAQTRGLDATNWGEDGVDLIARLKELEDVDGRFTDNPDYGDDFKAFGHAFAIIALARQDGEAPSDASLDLLLESQCPDGGFSGNLRPTECSSGVDSTALAVQALLAAGRAPDADEIDDAIAHLVSAQNDDGGFGTAAGQASNANSTGLAVLSLEDAGSDAAADEGQAYLLGLQIGCDDPEADRGAIAADDGTFDAATATRATTQAIYGLTGVGHADASSEGATAEQPRFVCGSSQTPTSEAPAGSPPTVVATESGVIGQAPAATPVVATPALTG